MVGRDVQLVVDKEPADPGELVLDVRDLVVNRRPRPAGRRRHVARRAGRRDRGHRRRAGQRPDRADRGDHRHCATPSRARSRSTAPNVTGPRPASCSRPGVAHVPEDRQRDGLIGSFDVAVEHGAQPAASTAVLAGGARIDAKAVRRHAADARRGVRRAHPVGRRRGVDAVGRQPAEGDRRPRVLPRPAAADPVAADPRPRRRVDPVHPPPDRGQARRRASPCCSTRSELDEVLALADRVAVVCRRPHRGRRSTAPRPTASARPAHGRRGRGGRRPGAGGDRGRGRGQVT